MINVNSDVVMAYKDLQKEKSALEASVNALSQNQARLSLSAASSSQLQTSSRVGTPSGVAKQSGHRPEPISEGPESRLKSRIPGEERKEDESEITDSSADSKLVLILVFVTPIYYLTGLQKATMLLFYYVL